MRTTPCLQNVIEKDFVILGDIVRVHGHKTVSRAFVRAGVRPTAFFDPRKVKAAVVTCGGLCPGLNNVIRQIVLDLRHLYGVTTVFGVRYGDVALVVSRCPRRCCAGITHCTCCHRNGYEGFHADTEPPLMLTPEVVGPIHHQGGSILGAGRGGFDIDVILNFMQDRGINQLYVIGGDGTMRAANMLAHAVRERVRVTRYIPFAVRVCRPPDALCCLGMSTCCRACLLRSVASQRRSTTTWA